MKPRAAFVVSLALVLAIGSLGGAQAATPKTSLSEISSEVMCPVCGTLLELAEAPQAQREKAFISRLVAAGRTKEQIKDALVAEYGSEVLAEPEGSGFDLSAYLVPAIGFAIAVIALAIGVARWRRRPGERPPPTSRPDGDDDERLDADMARYDL